MPRVPARTASGALTTADEVSPTVQMFACAEDLDMMLSLSGMSGSTVELQRKRRLAAGAAWQTLETFTADAEETLEGVAGAEFRLQLTVDGGTVTYFLGYPR